MIVEPRLAAAIALLRDAPSGGFEVFMVRRHIMNDFMPDVYVFPGGSISPDDLTTESLVSVENAHGNSSLPEGVRAAAARELFEEANILLASNPISDLQNDLENLRNSLNRKDISYSRIIQQLNVTLDFKKLRLFAHWITPEQLNKRFDTYFFAARLPIGQVATHDDVETSDGCWAKPSISLSKFENGEFPLVFATINHLKLLAEIEDLSPDNALDNLISRRVLAIMPRIVEENGEKRILIEEPGED